MNYHAHRPGISADERGMTLVELLVALTLSGLVATMIFAAWNMVHSHALRSQRKTMMQHVVRRSIHTIAGQLRRSSIVLEYGTDYIRYVSGTHNDTISYAFIDSRIRRNGSAYRIADTSITVEDFSCTAVNHGTGPDNRPAAVLSLTLILRDEFDTKVSFTESVCVRVPQGSHRDDIFDWGL